MRHHVFPAGKSVENNDHHYRRPSRLSLLPERRLHTVRPNAFQDCRLCLAQCVPWPTLSVSGTFSIDSDGVNPLSGTPPIVMPVLPVSVETTRCVFWITFVPYGRSAAVASMPESMTITEKSPLPETGIPPLRSVIAGSVLIWSTPVSILAELMKY